MLVEGLLTILLKFMDFLLVFQLPALAPPILDYVQSLIEYLAVGCHVLANYVPLSYLITLFFLIASMEGAYLIYRMVMWVLKKIPIANIK